MIFLFPSPSLWLDYKRRVITHKSIEVSFFVAQCRSLIFQSLQHMEERNWRKSYPGNTNLLYNLMVKFRVHLFLISLFINQTWEKQRKLLTVWRVFYMGVGCLVWWWDIIHTLYKLALCLVICQESCIFEFLLII